MNNVSSKWPEHLTKINKSALTESVFADSKYTNNISATFTFSYELGQLAVYKKYTIFKNSFKVETAIIYFDTDNSYKVKNDLAYIKHEI